MFLRRVILRTFVAPEVQLDKYRIDSAELCQRLLLDLRCMATAKGIFRKICGCSLCASVNSLAQLPERVQPLTALDVKALPLADRWILSRAQATTRECTASFEQFRLDEGAKRCFDFVWKELADWYVEAVKPRLVVDTGAGVSLRLRTGPLRGDQREVLAAPHRLP